MACFPKVWKLFGPISGDTTSLYIYGTPSKLRNHLGFVYIKNMLKDHLFKTSALQFDNGLFGPEKFSGLSRNRSLELIMTMVYAGMELGTVDFVSWHLTIGPDCVTRKLDNETIA